MTLVTQVWSAPERCTILGSIGMNPMRVLPDICILNMQLQGQQRRGLLRRRVWQYATQAVMQDVAAKPRWLSFADMRTRAQQRRAYQRVYLRKLEAQREGMQARLA